MKSLDSVIAAHPPPKKTSAALLVTLCIAGFIAWASVAQVDEVAVAAGEVVPQGQVKAIQHLEGGIIEQIQVSEGQVVAEGDPLVRLELGVGSVNTAELRVQIDGLMLKRARLQAEAAGRPPVFDKEMEERLTQVASAERQAYESRKRQVESGLEVLRTQARQRELQIAELETKLKGKETNLRLAERRLAMSADLLKKDLVPKMTHLELENEVETLRSDVAELKRTLPKAHEALAEAKERQRAEWLNFRRSVVEEMGAVEVAIARNRELMTKAADQVRRTLISSPIDGIVKNLRYHTIGGVVRPGETIMEIVPSREKLVVEAKLDPVDVGYVRAGQPAMVKLQTYDFVRYGGLDGKVINVAPDSNVDRNGRPFFKVVIQIDKPLMGKGKETLPIIPGMQAQVDVHTGQKLILEYLINPVIRLREEAFRER